MRPSALLCLLATLTLSSGAAAFCPSYTLSSSENNSSCGVEAAPGTNPSVSEWRDLIEIVAQGPSAWGSGGPSTGTIGEGCGKPEPLKQVPARFPCELLEGIAMQESGWRQFCVPDRPSDQVGGASRTIISFDCGYGVSQVTSGMHIGESPSYDRARVAGEALYNLATGATILAAKWRATQCVGDNQPRLIENWYTATWAYNSLSFRNNPNNPDYDGARGVWNPSVGGGAPYQEKVFGWAEHPPSNRWVSTALAYPDLMEIGTGSGPPALSEPACASPTDCVSRRAPHVSRCFPPPVTPDAGTPNVDGGVADAGTEDAGGTPEQDAGVAGDGGNTPVAIPFAGERSSAPLAEAGCGCASNGGSLFSALLLALSFITLRRRLDRSGRT